MLSISVSKLYKKQFKKLSKAEQFALNEVVKALSSGEILDQKYKDHELKLNFAGFRECHIKPNLLLIYQIKNEILELYLASIGSHQEVFHW